MKCDIATVLKKFTAAVLTASICLAFASCKDEDTKKVIPADYGSYGADIARELAALYPNRSAYSVDEASAGGYICDKMKELGYDPEIQTFTGSSGQTSHNYIVKIEGSGFYVEDDSGNYNLEKKIAIIGAHYDTLMTYVPEPAETEEGEEPEETAGPTYSYDGISDNASGIGCLLTALARAKDYTEMGYDVYFVAFGAGSDNYAGAYAFYQSLSDEERNSIEVMYCIESIYAGDKVYASAGYNSLISGKKYAMRRKLYQTYDVCYANTLYTNYKFDIYYNESGIKTDLDGDGVTDIYNEVSANKSDYVVFDEAGIPIVFFDSGDYNFKSMEEMKDTKNLNLQDFGGQIKGTPADSTELLDSVIRKDDIDEDEDGIPDKSGDVLQIRINAIAFVMLETLNKGSDSGMTPKAYKEYLANPTESTIATPIPSQEENQVPSAQVGG
ncbi:MAG: M28 family peptidase [Saccharofermentans sp.]|nr:M28 family peptidase [Saccharofermentans sp.]